MIAFQAEPVKALAGCWCHVGKVENSVERVLLESAVNLVGILHKVGTALGI
jgi:hypothetical protein